MTDGTDLVPGPSESLVNTTHLIYALHAVSLIIGTFGAPTIIGQFLFAWPSLIAVIINYIKRDEVRNTWLESHFRWQIRTFWYALLWSIIIAIPSFILMLVLVGFALWYIGMLVLGIWAIYRIARGWLALNDRKALPI
ncbi:DUF4870 family protein [Dentiradicibacter hellwigii]|uniref:Transmembrane protein n=1 Tax=Dentiradicibacter hellwigii TaxID=3149053 RepID=A0ABV4UDU9_9RHOO